MVLKWYCWQFQCTLDLSLQKFTLFFNWSIILGKLQNLFVIALPLRILSFLNTPQSFQFSHVFLKTCCVVIQLKKTFSLKIMHFANWTKLFTHTKTTTIFVSVVYTTAMWRNVRILYHLCSIRVGSRLQENFFTWKSCLVGGKYSKISQCLIW